MFPFYSCSLFWFAAPILDNGMRDDEFPRIINPHYFPTLNFIHLEKNVSDFPEPNTETLLPLHLWYRRHNDPNDWKKIRTLKWDTDNDLYSADEMDDVKSPRQERRDLWLERRYKRWKDCQDKYYRNLAREEEEHSSEWEETYSEDKDSDEEDIGDQETDRGSPPLGSGQTTPKNVALPLDDEEIPFSDLSSTLFYAFAFDADPFDPFLQILSFSF